jgi:hypothetical protein
MIDDIRRRIGQAMLAGAKLDEIQDVIIEPASLDAEEKSVLWLYADVLQDRTPAGIVAELER